MPAPWTGGFWGGTPVQVRPAKVTIEGQGQIGTAQGPFSMTLPAPPASPFGALSTGVAPVMGALGGLPTAVNLAQAGKTAEDLWGQPGKAHKLVLVIVGVALALPVVEHLLKTLGRLAGMLEPKITTARLSDDRFAGQVCDAASSQCRPATCNRAPSGEVTCTLGQPFALPPKAGA